MHSRNVHTRRAVWHAEPRAWQNVGMSAPAGPLAGLRVLDLGTRIGAPFAATLLADLGAEVIKVELPGQGDFMRTIGPFVDGYSLFWAVEGRNKKSVTIDLRKPAGQALCKRLVATSDVVVENFQPGTMEGWNLGYDDLAAVNPAVILTRVSVYGQDGPYRDRPGLDRNGIALGGLLYLTGYPDRPPVRPGLIVSDYLTAVFNAFAIVSALYERDRRARETGQAPRGQWVDLALYESILRIMEHTLATYDRLGVVREREGNRLRNSAPLDNWETKDGKWVCINAAGDGLFPRLARAMGRPDLLDEPRFATMATRAQHGDEINGIVADWVRERTSREVQDVLEAHEVPFGVAYSVADIFADPQVQARGDIETVTDPMIGPVRMQGVYPRFSRTPGSIRSGAPILGAHNDEVFGELLGLDAGERDALRRDRVI
jgi:crotonobetainyl-CoA:carnitine CoA-transferase CaiB-like acyl-CoA transferase